MLPHGGPRGETAEHRRPADGEPRADADPAPPSNVRPNADGSVPDHWVRDMMDGMTEQMARTPRMRRAHTRWTRPTSTPKMGTSPTEEPLPMKDQVSRTRKPGQWRQDLPAIFGGTRQTRRQQGKGTTRSTSTQVRGSDAASDGSEVLLQAV